MPYQLDFNMYSSACVRYEYRAALAVLMPEGSSFVLMIRPSLMTHTQSAILLVSSPPLAPCTMQGAFQLPLHARMPPPSAKFRAGALEALPRVPCASLVVRVLTPEAHKLSR